MGTRNSIPTDPMGGLYETHDYDPATRTFMRKRSNARCQAKLILYNRGRPCAQSARESGYCGTHERVFLRERPTKVHGKPISRSLSGINWVGFTDEELAALPPSAKR